MDYRTAYSQYKKASFEDFRANWRDRKDPMMQVAKKQLALDNALDDAGLTGFQPYRKPEKLGLLFRGSSRLRNAYEEAKRRLGGIKPGTTRNALLVNDIVAKDNPDLLKAMERVGKLEEKDRPLGGIYEAAKYSLPNVSKTQAAMQRIVSNSNPYETTL